MNCDLHKITYFALRTLLLVKLCEVIYLAVDATVDKVCPNTAQDYFSSSKVNLLLKSFSLKRLENRTFSVVYQSSIAFQLSSVLRRSSLEIAYQILDEFHRKNINLCQEDMTKAERILSDFTGSVFSDGLLQFELGDRGLSIWLQSLVESPSRSPLEKLTSFSINSLEDKSNLFLCQHSHARCCSLLRHAHNSVITLNHLDHSSEHPWMILTPEPIPWLTIDGNLFLAKPAERRLIAQIVTIADNFSDLMTDSQFCLAATTSLSQCFRTFFQTCQIFGSDSNSKIHLSQGRLGLVIITQRLLNQLIEVGLNEQAPFEL